MLTANRFQRISVCLAAFCSLLLVSQTQAAIVLNMALRKVEGAGGNVSYETFLGFQSTFDPQVQVRMPDGQAFSGGVFRDHVSLAAMHAATIGQWQVTTPTESGAFTLGSYSTSDFPAQPRVNSPDVVPDSFMLDLNSEDFADAREPAVLVDDISSTIDSSFLFSIYEDGDLVNVPLLPGETTGTFNLFVVGTNQRDPAAFLSNLAGDITSVSNHQVSFQTINPSHRLTVNAVPEPGALAFCAFVIAFAPFRRRRNV